MYRGAITTISAAAQVESGDIQVITIRETDGRLGPLVFTLVGLGCVALVSTMVFWWFTRPVRHNVVAESAPDRQGEF